MLKIDLSGRIALVTGASGDLGRVISETLAKCGADVVVHYGNRKQIAESVLEKVKAAGAKGMIVQADITDEKSVMQMKEQVTAQLGDPDIIVTAAVIQYEPRVTVLEQKLEDYEGQFKSCVIHNVLMAKAFVPAMIKKRWGRFIGINTECTLECRNPQSAYVAGKRGMDGVLRILAKEVGEHQITVNQVAPGWMISDGNRGTDEESQPEYEAEVPLKRRGEDIDIANAVAFLASDLANFISGVFLPVCGGHVMTGI